MRLPEKIRSLVAVGEKEVSRDRRIFRERNIPNGVRLWEYLCVDIKLDLASIAEYVKWDPPAAWGDGKTHHWLLVSVPGLSDLAFEYTYENGWQPGRYAFTCYEKGIKKFWMAYRDKSLEYVIALARESFLKREAMKNDHSKVVHEAPIPEEQAVS